jgi:hypothetical protein
MADFTAHDLLHGQKTLVCFLQGLAGRRVPIQLRDDSVVLGTIQSVDACMGCVWVRESVSPPRLPLPPFSIPLKTRL